MSYITDIFERTNIQRVREFILHGGESNKVDEKTYKKRIEDPLKTMLKTIRAKFPDKDECEEIEDIIGIHTSATEEVYAEIGMQCGFILATQLLARPPDE